MIIYYRRCTGQPLLSDIVRAGRLKLFGHVARADKSHDHSRALRACIRHSPKNWKRRLGRLETYLAENSGGRPASVQPRSCIRVQEGTGQNYLARTHGNGYITDKPRMMMSSFTGWGIGVRDPVQKGVTPIPFRSHNECRKGEMRCVFLRVA